MKSLVPGGRTALILTGGGARAAYQVGVLAAIRDLRGRRPGMPFEILVGTSAGAINATALAVFAHDFNRGVRRLLALWRNLHVSQVYRADTAALLAAGLRWGAALSLGWVVRQRPRSLFDNAPLRELLARRLDFEAIERNIADGFLHAISVSASSYTSGENIAFFQAVPQIRAWRRAQRLGVRTELGLDHLMASSALPFVFPAVHLHRQHFGDGSMRQLAPISPAIHLGAERVLVIGASRLAEESRQPPVDYPSPAQIAGHALSSIFLDTLAGDLESLQRINQALEVLTPTQREAAGLRLRPIETLVIAPSRRLDLIAGEHCGDLPLALRTVLRGIGAMRGEGSALLSYLLFEPGFTRELIALGYQDTMARREEVVSFLHL